MLPSGEEELKVSQLQFVSDSNVQAKLKRIWMNRRIKLVADTIFVLLNRIGEVADPVCLYCNLRRDGIP